MISEYSFVSSMLCKKPKQINNRTILSCSDCVWDCIETIPENICKYLSSDIGNEINSNSYAGFLHIKNELVLEKNSRCGIYTCFRAVKKEHISYTDTIPYGFPNSIMGKLVFVGFDIASGNGFLSASCHGVYPIDPFTGDELEGSNLINNFGLFDEEISCLTYCDINNRVIPEHAPWYPVAIYIDKHSFGNLTDC